MGQSPKEQRSGSRRRYQKGSVQWLGSRSAAIVQNLSLINALAMQPLELVETPISRFTIDRESSGRQAENIRFMETSEFLGISNKFFYRWRNANAPGGC